MASDPQLEQLLQSAQQADDQRAQAQVVLDQAQLDTARADTELAIYLADKAGFHVGQKVSVQHRGETWLMIIDALELFKHGDYSEPMLVKIHGYKLTKQGRLSVYRSSAFIGSRHFQITISD